MIPAAGGVAGGNQSARHFRCRFIRGAAVREWDWRGLRRYANRTA